MYEGDLLEGLIILTPSVIWVTSLCNRWNRGYFSYFVIKKPAVITAGYKEILVPKAGIDR